ncbi:MAG: Smr/MutS family protein [Candidatus Acidiferrales bacterium]|jgi:DNA mismatch repair protein MutS2
MSRSAQDVLELDRLRDLVRGETTCALGRRAIDALEFSTDRAYLDAQFELIAEGVAYLRAGSDLGFGALPDPAEWLAKAAAPGTILTPLELLDAASLVETTEALRQTFRGDAPKFPLLAARAASLADSRALAREIRRVILPDGTLADDASPALKRARTALGRTRVAIEKALDHILRERGLPPGEDYVTRRNDRFVVPVRAAERRTVPGVVHASSATGQTLFVEPFETVELNNRLVELTDEEAAEIARLLEELTHRVQDALALLRAAAAAVAEFDSLFARARFSRRVDCARPIFGSAASTAPHLALRAARHPVLDDALRRQGRAAVPITLELGGAETVLVISGPNTGGKTVALKTVGLAALAAQCAIPVAADSAELPIFDRILADIGDEQSITADLSTFSAHVLNLRAMLEVAGPGSLVLADEMGTGTAPEEGAALAVALLDAFRARGGLTLATTHHDRLKSYAAATPGVLNASVEFDAVALRPTYKLRVGVPGGSSGIEIAERLGLPHDVIERARALLEPAAREAAQLISYLHRVRDDLEQAQRDAATQARELDRERQQLRTEWIERQRRRIAELEREFAEAMKLHEKQIAQAIEAVKDRELRAQLEKQTRRKISGFQADAKAAADAAVLQQLSASQADLGVGAPQADLPPRPDQLVEGARVRVRGWPAAATLRRRDDSTAEVEAGSLRMKIALEDIVAVLPAPAPTTAGKGGRSGLTVHAKPDSEDSETDAAVDEINLIGCTVEEATRRADKFIDQAAVAGKPRVRLIHGHGTGALRRGLAEFLSTHPLVERIAAEAEERGGTAITVVDLKD